MAGYKALRSLPCAADLIPFPCSGLCIVRLHCEIVLGRIGLGWVGLLEFLELDKPNAVETVIWFTDFEVATKDKK